MDMSVETLVSVEQYLNTSYDPDVEYVDGVLVERNVGDWAHSKTQTNLILAFGRRYPDVHAVPELRSRTRETRYRLPDVCVLPSIPETKYLVEAAYIAIEVLSEDDRMSNLMEKLEEYAKIGVPNIWVIDPRRRILYVYANGALTEIHGSSIATATDPRLEVTRSEIFRDLEKR